MSNILIVSGHNDLENNSFANKIILERLNELLPEAEFLYLDKTYPEYKFDVAKEQERLKRADVIVMQFPFFWYSVPALMHKWMEDVFVHGFSHGSKGKALVGKKLIISFTSGTPEYMYQKGELQKHTIEEFLTPLIQFAATCGMDLAGIIYSGGLSYANGHDEEQLKAMREKAIKHAEKLAEKLKSL